MSGILLGGYVAVFIATVLVVIAVTQAVTAFLGRDERTWLIVNQQSASKPAALIEFLKRILLRQGLKLGAVQQIYKRLKTDVVRANYTMSAEDCLADMLFEGLVLFVIATVFCAMAFGPFSIFVPIVLAVAWALWVRPGMVGAEGEKRSRAVYRRIPYALDLGVLVLESGGTLREALEVVATTRDPLAEELRTAFKEMDSGASQAAALTNMSGRVCVAALETIVLAINRGAETGAPMAQTLSTQAELFRARRLQEVEKLAVEAPTKMTLPNMLVMVSVLLIVIGPLLIKLAGSGLL